jgi:hypothetical protein
MQRGLPSSYEFSDLVYVTDLAIPLSGKKNTKK